MYWSLTGGKKVIYYMVLLLHLTGARKVLQLCIFLPSLEFFFPYFLRFIIIIIILLQDYIFITEISCLNGDRKAKIFLAGTKLFDLLMEKDRTNSSYRLEIHCSYPCTTSLMNYSFFNTMVCEEFQTFPTLNYIFFFLRLKRTVSR